MTGEQTAGVLRLASVTSAWKTPKRESGCSGPMKRVSVLSFDLVWVSLDSDLAGGAQTDAVGLLLPSGSS